MSRWTKELLERVEAMKALPADAPPVDEFDAVFGAAVERTMGEYRLMVAELLKISLWIKRFVRVFLVLSVLLFLALVDVVYLASFARANARMLNEHVCLTYEAHDQVPPKAAGCPGR